MKQLSAVQGSLERASRIVLRNHLEPGTYRYTCGMGMYGGSIRVVA